MFPTIGDVPGILYSLGGSDAVNFTKGSIEVTVIARNLPWGAAVKAATIVVAVIT